MDVAFHSGLPSTDQLTLGKASVVFAAFAFLRRSPFVVIPVWKRAGKISMISSERELNISHSRSAHRSTVPYCEPHLCLCCVFERARFCS